MDTMEREREREAAALATSSHRMYDYTQKSSGEMARMLEERDRKIAILEKQLLDYGLTIPNYPPCFPLIRIDISGEVPARRQGFARLVLYGYYYTAILLIFNMICFFIASQAESKDDKVNQDQWEEGQWMSIAFLLGIPIAFPLWFYTTYTALTTGKPSRYVFSLIGLFIGCAGAVFGLIGMLTFGTCGAFSTFRAKDDKGNTAFYAVLAVWIAWCLDAVLLAYAFVQQARYMRQDRKIAQLSAQAAQMLMKSAVEHA